MLAFTMPLATSVTETREAGTQLTKFLDRATQLVLPRSVQVLWPSQSQLEVLPPVIKPELRDYAGNA